jgi:CTP:molybdopterin cytidylyltransferase MocA
MGGFKPLLPVAGATLVEVSVRSALEADCRVLLVVGHWGKEVAALFEAVSYADLRQASRIVIVENPRWEEGMVGSIQAALPKVEGAAFFVSHADMPFVAAKDYRSLASAWAARSEAAMPVAAIFAAWDGRVGHPALLPAAWVPELLALPPGDRLRPFLEGRERVLVETGPSALRDIDRPEEYQAALRELTQDGKDVSQAKVVL